MNTEEKAEAYDKAIEGIQEILSSGQEFINMSRLKLRLQPFFPELRESEDEKVMKKLIHLVKKSNEQGGCALHKWEADEMLAWLEKQGEQKPTDTNFSDLTTWKYIVDAVLTKEHGIGNYLDYPITEKFAKELQERFGSIEQKPIEEINCEDYGIDGLWHAQRILEKTLGKVDGYQTDDGILEHKCAISAVKKLYEHNPTEWKQENREELTEFENAMMHIGGSFFGENAGLDPNDTAAIKEQAKLLLELAPKTEWSEEDKKIRETLIGYFKNYKTQEEIGIKTFFGIPTDDIIAWLEKQGGNKPIIEMKSPEESLGISSKEYNEIVNDCLYSESKSADKVEPKFKVGDWVVWDNKVVCNITGYINEDKKTLMYIITDTNGMERTYSFNGFDNNARLWDIQDAKDGDVLACESGWTCIFKTLVNDETFSSYCFMDNTKWFCETGSECHTLKEEFVKAYNGKIYPATKEQRDTLIKAMADAGWEFDFKKKELKKIEQKPSDKVETKFHEGDWVVVSTIKGDRVVQIASVEYLKDGCPSYITTEGRWFGNRTKARLLTNKDVEITTIPESRAIVNKIKSWSEEDENKIIKKTS